MTAFEASTDAKESHVRPPGQMSTDDLLGDLSAGQQRPLRATFVSSDPTRNQSIQSLVAHLSVTQGVAERPTPSNHVAPNLTTNSTPSISETIAPLYELRDEPEIVLNKSANHDAIVKHFHLRRVLEDDNRVQSEDDGEYHADVAVDGVHAQRMVLAAKIHEFRRAKSRHDSKKMTTVVTFIPVSKRGLQRRLRRLRQCLRDLLDAVVTPFSPTGYISKLRGCLLLLTMLLQLLVMPFAPVYFPKSTKPLDALQVGFDVVYVLDFVASCNTAFYGKAEQLEFSRRKILARYIKSGWPFGLDLVSSVPVDTIVWFTLRNDPHIAPVDLAGYVLAGELHSVLRFVSWAAFLKSIWFVRVVRATKDVWFRVVYSRVSYALALVHVVLVLLYVAHYVACFWRLTVQSSMPPHVATVMEHPWEMYVHDLYYAAQLLQGQGVAARHVNESIFGSVAVLFGCLAIAYVISCVSLILITSQSNSSLYQRKLETVFATMDKMQLPPQLRRRIHQYYNHLWFEHDSIDGDIAKFSHELSQSLGLEVRLFKYMDLVLSVPYWRTSSADFVTHIMLSLDVRAYLPEDYIVRQGEVGDGLFLINRGLCELTSCPDDRANADGGPTRTRNTVKTAANAAAADNAVNVRRLMAGHSFGELALLMNYRRTADVRAVSYVEMCVLGRQCFQKLLIRYREDRREVLRELVLSCMEKSGMRFIAFPWEDMVDRMLRQAPHPSRATNHTQLTPSEAADLIVDVITPEGIADATVTFGFHDFDSLSQFQLTPITMTDRTVGGSSAPVHTDRAYPSTSSSSSSCCDCRARTEKMINSQQQTLSRLASLESLVGDLVREIRQNRKN